MGQLRFPQSCQRCWRLLADWSESNILQEEFLQWLVKKHGADISFIDSTVPVVRNKCDLCYLVCDRCCEHICAERAGTMAAAWRFRLFLTTLVQETASRVRGRYVHQGPYDRVTDSIMSMREIWDTVSTVTSLAQAQLVLRVDGQEMTSVMLERRLVVAFAHLVTSDTIDPQGTNISRLDAGYGEAPSDFTEEQGSGAAFGIPASGHGSCGAGNGDGSSGAGGSGPAFGIPTSGNGSWGAAKDGGSSGAGGSCAWCGTGGSAGAGFGGAGAGCGSAGAGNGTAGARRAPTAI